MNQPAFFRTWVPKGSTVYPAQNTARNQPERASVRLVHRFQSPRASALRLMNHPRQRPVQAGLRAAGNRGLAPFG